MEKEKGNTSRRPGSTPPPEGPPASKYSRLKSAATSDQRQPGPSHPASEAGSSTDASSKTAGRGTSRARKLMNADLLNSRPVHVQTSKKGTGGSAIKLQANFFKILSAPDWCLLQYRVDFAPEEDRTIVRKGLLRLHKEKLGIYMFDGSAMYSCNRYQNVSKTQIEIPEYRFELWPGYQTSIRQHERDVLMGVEITHKVMRQETLLDILGRTHNNARGGDIQGACKAEVIGVTVLTAYNNNTYRIDDIDFSKNPTSTFRLKKNETLITYMDYYYNQYGIRINNKTQPLLVARLPMRDRRAGKDELLYLIPELCKATGLTDEMRTNYKLMAKLATFTRLTPERRIDRLLHFNKRLQSDPKVVEEFSQWNLKLDTNVVEIPARVITPENLVFGNMKQSATQTADWTRHFRSARLIVCTKLAEWILIVPERIRRDAHSFVSNIIKVGQGMSFRISQPQIREIRNDSAQSYAEELERVLSHTVPQLVCCISARSRADVYAAVKKKCCLDRPVPSQVVLSKNLASKGAMSIATKIAIQMNCKIGGAPWSIDFGMAGLMVVGFDVCHDPNQRGTDFGAMVASLDRGMTRYFSSVSSHRSNEELTNEFSINMVKALRKYSQMNGGKFPTRIVIYRDGVGDGQIPYVLEHEVEHLREALAKLYGRADMVKLAFIIVTKRINTRLFYNRRDNPPPGTVVDDVITNPWRYDFFIVSQCVKQGSVSPTAYNVIFDNAGLDVTSIQRLTFQLTHMYFNWSGTVRVPAPCQYAHKLAFLVAQSIHRPPSSHLETLLYFL
ncbi:hypothetical protein G9C98_005082 [Cotesia typhae]|uniref:Uncharacterized protein n=1 Tax=Cotesia typhae TaxID=2053667 RepID=A0A8J5QYF2_9HYME|nr:hypothetical protein G9C98_005082 [Cotesia typhae]